MGKISGSMEASGREVMGSNEPSEQEQMRSSEASGQEQMGSKEASGHEQMGSNKASGQEVGTAGRVDEFMDYLNTFTSSPTKSMGDFRMPVSCLIIF